MVKFCLFKNTPLIKESNKVLFLKYYIYLMLKIILLLLTLALLKKVCI